MFTLESVCSGAQQLPCSPSLLPQVVSVLQDQDAQLEDLEQLINRDIGLSAAILKLVNSVSFNAGRSYDSLHEAILRLGMRETYRLVVSVLGGKWAAQDFNAFGWNPGDFCRHSFAVAVATRRIALAQKCVSSDLAYTAGLIHDVGKLALAYVCANELEAVRIHQERHGCLWTEAESAVLGFTHCEVSEELLRRWSFPANLIAVGRWYEHPDTAPDEHRDLVALVHYGKHLAIQTGIGGGEDAFFMALDESLLPQLRLSEKQLQAMVPDLVDELNRILGARVVAGRVDF